MYAHIAAIGYLGGDPETRTLDSGDSVTNISVATSERWKDKTSGEKMERTTWIRASLWGKLAEIGAQYLKKGSLVYIEGQPMVRAYTNKAGEAGASLECRVSTMKMLSSSGNGGERPVPGVPDASTAKPAGQRAAAPAATTGAAPNASAPPAGSDFDDDIPF